MVFRGLNFIFCQVGNQIQTRGRHFSNFLKTIEGIFGDNLSTQQILHTRLQGAIQLAGTTSRSRRDRFIVLEKGHLLLSGDEQIASGELYTVCLIASPHGRTIEQDGTKGPVFSEVISSPAGVGSTKAGLQQPQNSPSAPPGLPKASIYSPSSV